MTLVVVSLGSNLGDRLAALNAAVGQLDAADDVRVIALSPIYETAPVGGPPQPDYLNAVALLETTRPPYDLLELTQRTEAELGRVRRVRWGARAIDIDIVMYGDEVSADERLTLPHPRAAERAFVLVPWLDVDPHAALPDGRTVSDVVAALDTSGVRARSDLTLEPAT